MRKFSLIPVLLALMLLCACWDKVELEERSFVVTVGIDAYEKEDTGKKSEENTPEADARLQNKAMQPMSDGGKTKIEADDESKNNKDSESKKQYNSDEKDNNSKSDNKKKESPDQAHKKTLNTKIGNEATKRFSISLALPNMAVLAERGGGEGKSRFIKKSSSETVSGAMTTTDSYSSKKLYYGQTKLVVFGENVLKDEKLFREAVDALERNRQISRKVIILAANGKASDIVEAKVNSEPMIGLFVSNFYKNKQFSVAVTFRKDLESLVRSLRASDTVVIPEISLEGEEIVLKGAAVVKNYKLVGTLNDVQTRGYLWARGRGEGGEISCSHKGDFIPLKVEKVRGDIGFDNTEDFLISRIKLNVTGNIPEFKMGLEKLDQKRLNELQKVYEGAIKKEILDTWDVFKYHNADGLELKDLLRKKKYDLFKKYETDWDKAFADMKVDVEVKVEIVGTGSIT